MLHLLRFKIQDFKKVYIRMFYCLLHFGAQNHKQYCVHFTIRAEIYGTKEKSFKQGGMPKI